jgi:subtilisin family serine protease
MLGGGFGAGTRVVGGWDFAENDANPYDDGPNGSHGTHVAGIIGSSDGRYPGVAPGVDLVACLPTAAAGPFRGWKCTALVIKTAMHRNRYLINISLGASTTAPALFGPVEDELQQLRGVGFFVAGGVQCV